MRLAFLILLFAFGCKKVNQEAKLQEPLKEKSATPELVEKSSPKPKLIDYEIADFKEEVSIAPDSEFGKFYNDRVSIHIIDNPTETIFSNKANTLTLYFIDSVLCKKKYELEVDISSDLMEEFGSFSFKPLDWNTRDLAKENGVVVTTKERRLINPQLKKYRMKWSLEDKDILFRHEWDSISSVNTYEEEMPEYKHLLKLIQHGLI